MTLFPKCAICAKMKTFLVILLCFLVENVPLTRGAVCPSATQRADISDTDVGVDFLTIELPSTATFNGFKIQDNSAVDTDTAATYFTAVLADSTFTASTTEAFKNLGIDADSNGSNAIVFTMYASLTCDNNNLTMLIVLRISDTYSHNPQFPAESYTYSIPMPIMTRTDITLYGDEITITDINFSNTGMTLTVLPDDFAVTVAKTDNKHFKAVFSARSILRFSEDQNYVLTASNSGGKTSTAKITIKVDPVAGLDAPSFTKSYYSFDYSSDSLTPKDGNIVIKSDKPNEAQYKLDGDLSESFKVTFSNETLTFQLALDTSLPSDRYGQVVLTLSYTTDATTNAILLINIVKTEVIPKFSEDYYTGTYDVDTGEISWAQEISIANAFEVKLAEGKSNLFTIDKSTYKIKPVNPLSKSDFDDNSNIIFKVIAASSSKNESQAIVVVSLKTEVSEELQFDRAFYSATYSVQNEVGVVTLVTDIGFLDISDFTGINIQIDDAYNANFKVEVDSSKWKISVLTPLSDTILDRNTELAIPIVATKTGLSVQASAVLILTLPKQVQIKFGNSYYTGSYSLGTDLDSVELDQVINISGDKLDNIKITVEGYEKNFEVKLNSDASSYEIIVKSNLNSTILNAGTVLPLKLKASTTKGGSTDNTVLILKLPEEKLDFHFKKSHYEATYNIVSETKFTVTVNEAIEMIDAENVELQFSFEDFGDNFELKLNPESLSYEISVIKKLDSSVLQDNTELIITITAFKTDDSYTSSTVLVLSLPSSGSSFKFAKHHYSATYSIDADSKGVVSLNDGPIEITDAADIELQFSCEGFEKYLTLKYDSQSSSYQIAVEKNLDSSVLQDNTELVITITAFKTDDSYTSSTVLVLHLPSSGSSFKFAKHHYSATYSIDADSKGVVSLNDGPIEITDAADIELQFSCEEYDQNFELAQDQSGTWSIQVIRNLDSSVLESHNQLIITITASATNGGATADTVLILDLPERKLAFSEKYYTASYQTDSGGSVQLDEAIALNSKGYTNIQVMFESLKDNFEFESTSPSGSYSIKVKKPLTDTVLSLNNQLVIVITASDLDSTASTSAILLIKLPSFSNNAFENEHYVAEYKASTDSASKDEVNVIGDRIKVKTADYSSISFAGYEGNLEGTCDSSTLECAITVKSNLNASVLSSHDELLVTLIASDADRSNIGRTVLMLTLPSKQSTFSFAKQHYGAIYSIQKSNDAKATIELSDVISLQDTESADVRILVDDYPEYFEVTLDSSTYNINILKNLDVSLLSDASELVTSLTATKTGQNTQDYAKATLVIKLPDSTTVAFKEPQYYGEYVIDDPSNPQVVLDSDSPIEANDFENSKIVLDSFTENFAVELGSDSKWNVNSKIPLNSSILSQYSELKLVMTITKIGVSYGNAALNIRLPSLSFAKNLYWGSYSIDDSGVGSISDIEIDIANVDPSYIQINLTGYNENFYTELANNKWMVKIGTPLPAVTTGPLVTNLEAIRISDSKVLGTSVLVIRLPNENVADAPKFSNYTFFGSYKNSDVPTVELRELISLSDDSTDSECEIFIDSTDEYSTNFSLKVEDEDQYSVNVATPLSQDVLDNLTNVVFTLVAKSTEGKYGFATLVISLPKALRNTSVQVENEEILFTGTYEDGAFKSPKIYLKTNSTDSDDISVKISNDLGINNSYFTPSYSDGVLLIQVGELPQDVLNKTSVIPLKLAITDRSTQDTVRAVLNIEIDGNSDDNGNHGGNGTDSAHIGLLVAVIILAVLLLLLLLGAFLFWFFKLRSTRSADMTDGELSITTKSTSFTKNEIKKPTTTGLPSTSIRRPTGLPIGLMNTVAEESTSDQGVLVSVDKSPSSEFEKKVAFDDKVENIDQEDENDDDNGEPSEGLQSVADRRPTKFVFGYPLEAGLFDEENGRRESSDFITNPEGGDEPPVGDRKKSVAFDENVERMHIDRVEDDEDKEESGSEDNNKEEPNSTEDSFKTEAKLQIGGDEKLPSEIFKEIF